jgi:hypothetical protein
MAGTSGRSEKLPSELIIYGETFRLDELKVCQSAQISRV